MKDLLIKISYNDASHFLHVFSLVQVKYEISLVLL